MNIDDKINPFLGFLVDLVEFTRKNAIIAEDSRLFSKVSTGVYPARSGPSDYSDGGGIISVSLDAELRDPLHEDKRALGTSVLLRSLQGKWIVEYEVGWSGKFIGWDNFASEERSYSDFGQLISESKVNLNWMHDIFLKKIEEIRNKRV